MKVAVISDIHGNMQALEAVLADIKADSCDKILCLGDLAMAGPEPAKTIELIKRMYENGEIELIQGNTDEMIATPDTSIPYVKEKFPIMGNALENDVKIIPQNLKDFLKELPAQKELIFDGVKVLMVHGSPRKNDENISPDLPLSKIEEMIENTDANLILCGHTHIPCGYQTSKKQTVVNDGSVGRPFTPKPDACYAIIDFKDGTFEVEHKFVDYDREKAAKILAARVFEGAGTLAKTLIRPEQRHL